MRNYRLAETHFALTKGATMSEQTLKPIRCRLCRKHPKVVEQLSGAWMGCGCGVCVWAQNTEKAANLWNRLMRVKK